MKSESRQVTMYTTMYISEDGKFESKDPNEVKEYEKTCVYKHFTPVFMITTDLLHYGHPLEVYKCESEQEYNELITFCGIEYKAISEGDKYSARKRYKPVHKYWVPILVSGTGGLTAFYVEPLDIILAGMEHIEADYNIFMSDLEEVRKLVKDEEVE